MVRRIGVFGVFFLVGACSSNTSPQQTTPNTAAIPTSVSGPLSANLVALAQKLSGPSALAAQAAALALQSGVQANPVTFAGGAGSDAPSRSAALVAGNSGNSFAFQLTTITTSATGTTTQVSTGIVAYDAALDVVVVQGPNGQTSSPVPPASGFILTADGTVYGATAGQESAQLTGTTSANPTTTNTCTGTVPSYITGCSPASFAGVAFNITASELFSGGNGTKTPALASGTVTTGVALTINCTQSAQSTLCASSTPISILVSPASVTLPPGGTEQFEAYVTGTSATPQWSITASVTGQTNLGTVSPTTGSDTTYTAPSALGTYFVTATAGGQSSAAVVTVAAPTPSLQRYWQGNYTITPSSGAPVTGSNTFVMQDSAVGCPAGSSTCLYFDFFCTMLTLIATYDPAGDSSATAFTIQPNGTPATNVSTCSQPRETSGNCPNATFTLTGGSGSLDVNGNLNMTFTGTTNGLFGTPCGGSTSFTGTFGPGTSVD